MTTTKTATTITVREQIDPAGIGDSTGNDRDWQERVCDAIDAELTDYLSARFPGAEIDVEVTVGQPGRTARSVEIDGERSEDLERDVRDASQRGFDKAC